MNRQLVYDFLKPCIDKQASIVRMFNTVPGLSIDIYINDSPRIVNLEYGDLRDYMPTVPGKRSFKIYQSKTDNILLSNPEFEIPGGQIFTYAFFGSLSDLKFLTIVDDINETVAPDRTKVRFYNLTANEITLNVYPSISISYIILPSAQGTNYTSINPGSYNLQINFLNQHPKNISISFKPGRIYTVYIFNSISSDSQNYSELNIPQVALVVDGNTLFNQCVKTIF